MLTVGLAVAALVVGFGMGRVKNSKKLAAVRAELSKAEASATAEVKSLVEKLKSVL